MIRLSMSFLRRFERTTHVSGLLLLLVLLIFALPVAASAATSHVLAPTCHAVTPLAHPGAPEAGFPHFTCADGAPERSRYQRSSLWYRIGLAQWDRANHAAEGGPVLMVGTSRFDRLEVYFRYADGEVRRQSVVQGDFGGHWRAGGQIAFEPPVRDQPLADIVVRFDRLASARLLRLRLVDVEDLNWQATALAVAVGGALVLLAVGAIYNLTLALTAHRQFALWQSGWAGVMFVWGALWSQLALFIWPGMAGAPAAQVCTMLSCFAVALATLSAVTALEEGKLPRGLRRAVLLLAGLIALVGIPLGLLRTGPIATISNLLGVAVLLDLLLVALCLALAWRRGSRKARLYTAAWALPMATLGLIEFADIDVWFYGAGSQILVLCAAAWQTILLAVAISRASGQVRIERDLALRSEAQAQAQARLDPLTGLRNRRGFMEAIAPMLEAADREGASFALLLFDVDRFKLVNDTYGHDIGDDVLVAIAQVLAAREGPYCRVARLGGEEFAMAVAGMSGFALRRFADSVRRAVEGIEHTGVLAGSKVTVSIGLAGVSEQKDRTLEGTFAPLPTFRDFYHDADAALYRAKREGRNRVAAAMDGDSPGDGDGEEAEASAVR